MIETSQLQILIALENAHSLSQAAEMLGVTQSAVSQNLKSLEAKVGFSVVARQGKKMVLTKEGRRLAKVSRHYTQEIEQLISGIFAQKGEVTGRLALGTMFGIGKSWVGHRMIEFSTAYPSLKIEVQMDFPDTLLNSFEKRELDCLILPQSLTPAHSESITLHNEMATLVYPRSEKFQISSESTLKDILEYPLIFFENKDPLFYTWCRQRFGQVPRNAQAKLIVNSFGQILHAVKEGIGVAVIPTHVFKRSHLKGDVQTLGRDHDVPSSAFNFIYHPESKGTLKINTLHQFLKKEVESLNNLT